MIRLILQGQGWTESSNQVNTTFFQPGVSGYSHKNVWTWDLTVVMLSAVVNIVVDRTSTSLTFTKELLSQRQQHLMAAVFLKPKTFSFLT